MKLSILIFCLLLFIIPRLSYAATDTNYRQRWAVAGYVGKMATVNLKRAVVFDWHFENTYLFALETNYTPDPNNIFRKLFSLIKATFEVSLNVTSQADKNGYLVEFNPFFSVRWNKFPWNHFIRTSFAIGEGISYATRQPFQEIRDPTKSENAKPLLNYLMFEIGLSLPKHPQWQLFLRIHHRSGAYGLFCRGIVGSTAVGLGLRYRFS